VKIPGMRLVRKAERTGNEVEVPLAHNLGLVELLKRTFKEASEDHLAAFAGNLTYKVFFALFPFFVFLLSLLGIFGAADLVNSLIDQLRPVLPGSATQFIEGQLLSIVDNKAQSAFTLGAIVSILFALWGVSGAFRSIMEAMNVMYEVEEARPAWKQYGISVFLSLGIAALLISALGLVVFGIPLAENIAENIPGLGPVFAWVWAIAQWPVLLGIVLFAFALVYYFAPDVEQRFTWISPGSIAAVVLWLLFSLLFSLYVNYSAESLNASYGSLVGIIILLLYIYYTSYILLLGAEMNQVIEEHIPEGKNEGEKTTNEGQ
jgi:membrane protein